jgi:hypothetical protein
MSFVAFYPWIKLLKLIAEGVLVSLIHQGDPQMCKIMRYDGLSVVGSSGYIYPSYDDARHQADRDQPHFPGTDTMIICIPARESV